MSETTTSMEAALVRENLALMRRVHELESYEGIVKRLAETREGCIALANVISRELDKISDHITAAVERCQREE